VKQPTYDPKENFVKVIVIYYKLRNITLETIIQKTLSYRTDM